MRKATHASDEAFEDGPQQSRAVVRNDELLQTRYGAGKKQRGDRLALLLGGGVLAALVLSFIGTMLFNQSVTSISYSDLSYQVTSNSATVTFEVTRVDPSLQVACAVEALSESHAPVGYKIVKILPSTATREVLTVALRTTLPPTAAAVSKCWVVAS
ncbi:DUF4307 domain-containing protein [Leucobacter sp. OH2974_COT-288]|uniref:DUF4307 domain-containing protein n=1 Tax=Canibacter oris TaxID=1365628 RepID=A0A840DGX7_9MICO|nr:DUF4307 domain-containing protein [Canibacter oris]MBB4071990.1 hypothetical protein [Canibacter oris]RRD35229.1 DUF4307 domain-containing protein [Leucobacter sp. OH2974_COT-288]